MGYAGKLKEKNKARALRRRGLSYREIQKQVDAAKSTISRWCRDIILEPEQLERLKKKRLTGSARGRIVGAKVQQQRRIRKTRKLKKKGIAEIGKLSKRERFIAGLGLYIGDGLKGDRAVGFSNSNPLIIRFMINWFREFLDIPDSRYRGQIWIHDNLDEKVAKNFWTDLTGIALKNFHKSYIAKNKKDSNKIRKKHHKYGVFSIKISSVDAQRKIKGWMAGILGNSV